MLSPHAIPSKRDVQQAGMDQGRVQNMLSPKRMEAAASSFPSAASSACMADGRSNPSETSFWIFSSLSSSAGAGGVERGRAWGLGWVEGWGLPCSEAGGWLLAVGLEAWAELVPWLSPVEFNKTLRVVQGKNSRRKSSDLKAISGHCFSKPTFTHCQFDGF